MTDGEWQLEFCAISHPTPPEAWDHMLNNADDFLSSRRNDQSIEWVEGRLRVITGYYLLSQGLI